MTSDSQYAGAVIRQQGHILLQRAAPKGGVQTTWHLPGGQAAAGELALETVVRAVRDSTGIEIVRVRGLIAVVQEHILAHDRDSAGATTDEAERSTYFLFEVAEWQGRLPAWGSGEGEEELRFWPVHDAVNHLQSDSHRVWNAPAITHMQGQDTAQASFYRREQGEEADLIWPQNAVPPEMEERTRRARAIVALGCLVLLAVFVIVIVIGLITIARPFA